MPRGAHSRSGPLAQNAQQRSLHGSRIRPQHRRPAPRADQAPVDVSPPSDLSPAECHFWTYYVQVLVDADRFTAAARDALSKYCTALAVVADLRQQLASPDSAARRDARRELRQWVALTRLIESDLLFAPAAALRVPAPEPTNDDPFTGFDTIN